MVSSLSQEQTKTHIEFTSTSGEEIRHTSPTDSLCLIQAKLISRKRVREYIAEQLTQVLPNNISDINVSLREEPGVGSWFEYKTDQGTFSLTLPEERVYLMESDTTVECIAEHILSVLEQEMPNARFKVRAYEGISKGAIAESD